MQSWFVWQGVSSLEAGVWVTALPPVTRAEQRVERVEIPGKAGHVTLLEGDDIYNSYLKEVTITFPRTANIHRLLDWLSGSGDLIFSNELGFAYEARIDGAVAFSPISNTLYQARIPFFVQPFKKQSPEESVIHLSLTANTAQTIYNPGNVASRPLVVFNHPLATVTIGGKEMSFTFVGDEHPRIAVDCDAGLIYNPTNLAIHRGGSDGDFWTIPVGNCQVKSTRNCSMTITPRWRWK